jgi:hypothetical protein
MRAERAIGLLLTIGLSGCGSSSDTTATPDASMPVADATAHDSAAATDRTGLNAPDLSTGADVTAVFPADVASPDATAVPGVDGTLVDQVASLPDVEAVKLDVGAVPDLQLDPDSPAPADVLAEADVSSVSDAPAGDVAQNDNAPLSPPDGGSVVASTTTPDDPSEPTVCSTVALGERDILADETYDIVMPDCLRVSGTVTLASPLPESSIYASGGVQFFKIVRDANGSITDNVVYSAVITPVDDAHFRYTVGVPADTYEVMYTFVVKGSEPASLSHLPSTASRMGQDRITVGASVKHDVTLPAIDVTARTVTVTGTDALPSHANQFGRYLIVYQVNTTNTLVVMGMSLTAGASVPISMWVPNETFTPTLSVQDSPGVGASGFSSQFKLSPVAPTGDFSLALPATVMISGSISDPHTALSRIPSPTGQETSGVNYYQCNSVDYGSFPNPIFFFPEASVSTFFADTTSHALFVRRGIDCVTYANYAIAIGPGGLPTRDGENTYVYIDDPSRRAPDSIVLTADVVRNIDVPAVDTQVAMRGTVKDTRGNAIPGAELTFNSDAMTSPAWANKTFNGGLNVGSTGNYIAHALPGRYRLVVKLATSSSSSGTNRDAGTASGGNDSSFAMPDLPTGAGGDCSTLAACCPKLSGSAKTGCETLVSMGSASTCNTMVAQLQGAGLCS